MQVHELLKVIKLKASFFYLATVTIMAPDKYVKGIDQYG
jgi:hypothetical protein